MVRHLLKHPTDSAIEMDNGQGCGRSKGHTLLLTSDQERHSKDNSGVSNLGKKSPVGKYAIRGGWDDGEVREVLLLRSRGPYLDPRTYVKQLGVETHNFRVGEVKTGRFLGLTSQPNMINSVCFW